MAFEYRHLVFEETSHAVWNTTQHQYLKIIDAVLHLAGIKSATVRWEFQGTMNAGRVRFTHRNALGFKVKVSIPYSGSRICFEYALIVNGYPLDAADLILHRLEQMAALISGIRDEKHIEQAFEREFREFIALDIVLIPDHSAVDYPAPLELGHEPPVSFPAAVVRYHTERAVRIDSIRYFWEDYITSGEADASGWVLVDALYRRPPSDARITRKMIKDALAYLVGKNALQFRRVDECVYYRANDGRYPVEITGREYNLILALMGDDKANLDYTIEEFTATFRSLRTKGCIEPIKDLLDTYQVPKDLWIIVHHGSHPIHGYDARFGREVLLDYCFEGRASRLTGCTHYKDQIAQMRRDLRDHIVLTAMAKRTEALLKRLQDRKREIDKRLKDRGRIFI